MKKSITLLSALLFWATTSLFAQNSLEIIDPDSWNGYAEGGTIEEALIAISPQGAYMETELYLTFSAEGIPFSGVDTFEIVFNFSLPEGAIMHDSWLWMFDEVTIVKADVLGVSQAEVIYEDIVDRRRDPSILYDRGGGNYELRVFPLPAEGSRKVKITYLSPAIWSANSVETWIPTEILQTSAIPLETLKVLTIPNATWQNPSLKGFEGSAFTAINDPAFGSVLVTEVPVAAFGKALRFSVDAPLGEEDVFVSRLSDGEDSFYQMVYMPPAVEDVNPKNIAILFDHLPNTTDVDKKDLFEYVQEMVVENLGAEDQFNMLFSKLSGTQILSDNWISGDAESIEEAFAPLSNPVQNYTDLLNLLHDGVDFVKNNGGEGDVVLMVSSNGVSSNLIEGEVQTLLDQINLDDIRIHIINYQGRNQYGGSWTTYYQQKFYRELTSATSGNYYHLRNSYYYPTRSSFNAWEGIYKAFSSLKNSSYDFDLHTSLDGGFTLQRFYQNYMGQSQNRNEPILQIGRYLGEFPFTVEFSTFVDGAFVFDVKEINEEQIVEADTLLREIWVGHYLPSLEGNTNVDEIVELSIAERVLTPHTAFLALDLENGGEPCWKCWEYLVTVPTTDENSASDLGINITASPNPFTDNCLLEFELDSGVSYNQLSMQIFDAFGKRIANINTEELINFGKMQWLWDGTDQNGSPLPSGMYYLIVKTAKGVQSFKLALVR